MPNNGVKAVRLVIKLGTEVLLDGKEGRLGQEIFNDIAAQVVELQNDGVAVAIVSSGAIKAGRERMESLGAPVGALDKKKLAGMGARHLLNKWGQAFETYEREVVQVWVTYANWESENEKQNIRSIIMDDSGGHEVPIVNENDVISDEEIKAMELGISENDQLAQMIAELTGADAVLFLTEAGGVYEEDPKLNPHARLYAEIDMSTAKKMLELSQSDESPNGRGGIGAKLRAAMVCAEAGMRVAVAGMEGDVIRRFGQGEPVGTVIGNKVKFR